MFAMLVEINIQAGKEAEFIEIFSRNQLGTQQEQGNLRFDVLRDAEIPSKFYAYEVYVNQEALETHKKTAHYQRCVMELEPIMSCSRQKKIFEWILPSIKKTESDQSQIQSS